MLVIGDLGSFQVIKKKEAGGGILNQITYNEIIYTEYENTGWDKKLSVTNANIRSTIEDIIDELGNTVNLNWLDVSGVTDMNALFAGLFVGLIYNGDISQWDVSNVTNMANMFRNSTFNQPLNSWDVSSVTNMSSMFQNTPFNQNISNWCVTLINTKPNRFDDGAGFAGNSSIQPQWGTCP